MATDLQSGHVIVSGGIAAGPKTLIGVFLLRDRRESPLADDTWIFDGENWLELDLKARPSHRQFAAMSACPDERGVLLFGGHGGEGKPQHLGDTWIFDGENWQEIHPPISPSPRQGACITYDSMKGQIVLFGGKDANGYLNDTWILNLSG